MLSHSTLDKSQIWRSYDALTDFDRLRYFRPDQGVMLQLLQFIKHLRS